MKFFLTLLFVAVFFSLAFFRCVNPGSTSNTTASITVTSPDLGGVWDAGTVLTIHWVSTGSVGSSVAITLYDSTTLISTIVSSVPNSGVYAWSISKQLPAGSEYRIKITSTSTAQVYGYSVPFTITNNQDDYEPDNSSSLATLIDTSGTLQTHRISVTDTDWFKFTATQGRTYCLQTYGSASTTLRLYATNAATLLSSSTGGGEGSNALIIWTCATGGVYYFKVTSPSGLAGAQYTVNVLVGSAILDITYPVRSMPFLSSGDTLAIQWVSSTNSGNYVSLYVYRADTLAYTITLSTSIYGPYNWIIPSFLTTSSKYQIKIVSNNDTSVSDLSDQFGISQISAALTITTPTATSTWNTGSSYYIYWVYSGNPGYYVNLALYDSTSLVTTITSNVYTSNKDYYWTIPLGLPNSSHYRIRIASTSDTTISSFSSAFAITKLPSSLTITTPSAASNWSTGIAYSINWSYTGSPGSYVSLSLYDSTSALVTTIAGSAYLSNQTYSWTVPSVLSTGKYRIKIASTSDTTVSGFSSAFTITKVASSLTITTPSLTTSWNSGSSYYIYWSYTGSPGSYVILVLYDSTSPVSTITSSSSLPSGSYYWTIPSNVTTGKYRIKIASASDTTVSSFSSAFAITKLPSSITITTPSAASNWSTGTAYSINWTYTGNPGSYVSLWLYDSASALVTTIASSAYLSNQTYSWTVPSVLSTGKYRIKIASTSDTTVSSFSSAFTITKVPSSLTITTPSATSSWSSGIAYYIYWSYTGSPGTYISLTLYDSTSLVTTITASYSMSNGSYYWTIPSALSSSSKYRIKIASTADTSITSFSSQFTITKAVSALAVTTPSAASSWSSGSSYYVYWTYTGIPGNYISLALFDSNSTQVSVITSSYSLSSGSYYWTIPSTVTTGKYRIKIASTSDTTINGFSSVFPITKIPSTITVTTPTSSSNWSTGTSYYIYWTYSGNPGSYVNITLYDSLSSLVATIATSVYLSNGDYSWAISQSLSTGKYRIKVTSTADTSVSGFSSLFAITKTPSSIIITTPSSTTSWSTGSSQAIFWAYSGSPCSYVSISLLDSTSLAATILSSVLLSTGYYAWSIPATLSSSTKYRIKIACTTDTSYASLSSYFTITKAHGQ